MLGEFLLEDEARTSWSFLSRRPPIRGGTQLQEERVAQTCEEKQRVTEMGEREIDLVLSSDFLEPPHPTGFPNFSIP